MTLAKARTLAPTEQLRVLSKIWGPNRDGYVFLPWILGSARSKEERRKNYHEGRAYEWPREKADILSHLRSHQSDDLYFCPSLFNGKRRNEELADAEKSLWADLDAVDPSRLGSLRPTIAWESSPKRYQGVWILDRMRHGASWPGKENHRLTYAIGADRSGWDTTQLLRVPGRANHKPDYRSKNGDAPVQGRLLWDNGPRYVWEDFDDLPEIGIVDGDSYDLLDEDFLQGIDRHRVWGRVRLRVSPGVRQFMAVRSQVQADEIASTQAEGRSGVLWQIERELADAGCTLAEIVSVIRPSVWNKFSERNDELKQLKAEAAKAIAAVKEGGDGGALEVIETPKPDDVLWLHQVGQANRERPKWLVKDIWTEGGCGFIAGSPKSYKSYFALDLAVSLATGTPFLNDQQFRTKRPCRVLYLQEEDALSLVLDRLEFILHGKAPRAHWHGWLSMLGGRVVWNPPDDVPMALHVRTGFVVSDESWQSWLDEVIAEQTFKLVVIDTLSTTAGAVDTDKSQDLMNKILKPLRELSSKHGCAVALVHHNKKESNGGRLNGGVLDHLSDRAGRDMLGSVQLHAWVDCALYVRAKNALDRLPGVSAVDESGAHVGVRGTEVYVEREAKLSEEMRMRIGIPFMRRHTLSEVWNPQVTMGWQREKGGDEDTKTRPETNDHRRDKSHLFKAQLREFGMTVQARALSTDAVAERMGLAPSTVKRKLSAAVASGWLARTDVGTYWLS